MREMFTRKKRIKIQKASLLTENKLRRINVTYKHVLISNV